MTIHDGAGYIVATLVDDCDLYTEDRHGEEHKHHAEHGEFFRFEYVVAERVAKYVSILVVEH